MNVLIVGGPAPEAEADALDRLARWNGNLVTSRDPERLKRADLVLVLPGGNGEAQAQRAREAGVRVAEVVG